MNSLNIRLILILSYIYCVKLLMLPDVNMVLHNTFLIDHVSNCLDNVLNENSLDSGKVSLYYVNAKNMFDSCKNNFDSMNLLNQPNSLNTILLSVLNTQTYKPAPPVYVPPPFPLAPLLELDQDDLRAYGKAASAVIEEAEGVLKRAILPADNV